MESHKISNNNAFTLVETLIVMSLVLVITSFGFVMSKGDFMRNNLRDEVSVINSLLVRARNQSINTMCFGDSCVGGKKHGVYITEHSYVLFQGDSYLTRDVSEDEIVYPKRLIVITGLQEIVFELLSGSSKTPGNIVLSDENANTYTVSINTEGVII